MPGRRAFSLHPLARAALGAAVFSALASLASERPREAPPVAHVPEVASALRPVCGLRAIPEGTTCVPLPRPERPLGPADTAAVPAEAAEPVQLAFVPRRPDRPAPFAAYRWPLVLSDASAAPSISREVDASNRLAGEHVGLAFAAQKDDRVLAFPIDHQHGPTTVAFVGEWVGITVVTAHPVDDGGRTATVLVIYGHLDRPGPGVVQGARLSEGDLIGAAGDTGSLGVTQLYVETRIVREGALSRVLPETGAASRARIEDDSLTIAIDPRNVFPLLAPPSSGDP